MKDNFDCTSDLPDNFDPHWMGEREECDETSYEQAWEDWRDECYEDDWYHDSAVWESAYGPADDGGWSF